MERITIDVTRSRGTRHAIVRLNVGPTPGEAGSSWTSASVRLGAEVQLTAELASHIAHSIEQAIETYSRGDLMAIPQPSLPF